MGIKQRKTSVFCSARAITATEPETALPQNDFDNGDIVSNGNDNSGSGVGGVGNTARVREHKFVILDRLSQTIGTLRPGRYNNCSHIHPR
jgi:hypothetical protein